MTLCNACSTRALRVLYALCLSTVPQTLPKRYGVWSENFLFFRMHDLRIKKNFVTLSRGYSKSRMIQDERYIDTLLKLFIEYQNSPNLEKTV